MAASAGTSWSLLNIFSLFVVYFLFTSVTTNENTTTGDFNTTQFGENVTYNFTDYYSTTQPTVFESATPTNPSYSSTVEPALPAEPLPVSGRTPTPVTNGNLPPRHESSLYKLTSLSLLCLRFVANTKALRRHF